MKMKNARAEQLLVEQSRLERHSRISNALLTETPEKVQELLNDAKDIVFLWRKEKTCSLDYIERWTLLLDLPVHELASLIVSDMDGWGIAMRQCSPWIGHYK